MKVFFLVLSGLLFNSWLYADNSNHGNNKPIFINTGSFVYHLRGVVDRSKYTQFFDNQFVAIGFNINPMQGFLLGAFKNSIGDRCAILGFNQEWHDFKNNWAFEGMYAYAGEFFFDSFRHCADRAIYYHIKQIIKIGAVPYIYHGFSYEINSMLTLEAGLVIPDIAIIAIKWHF